LGGIIFSSGGKTGFSSIFGFSIFGFGFKISGIFLIISGIFLIIFGISIIGFLGGTIL